MPKPWQIAVAAGVVIGVWFYMRKVRGPATAPPVPTGAVQVPTGPAPVTGAPQPSVA